jgi:hypothetical protein
MKIRKNGKVIRLTESDLRRIVKRVMNEGVLREDDSDEGVKYGVKGGLLKIKKNNSGGNRIDVCFGERCERYEILGDPKVGSDEKINFKNMYKKSNGDLVFNRWVEGGKTKPHVIPKTDIYTYLIKPFKEGKSKITYDVSWLGDLVFKKV